MDDPQIPILKMGKINGSLLTTTTVVFAGPRSWPLIGNMLEIRDPMNMHLDFMRLGEQYGDVFSLYLGRQ